MGATHGYKIKNGQNPNGVQHTIAQIIIAQKCSTLSGLCYAICHSPWVSPMAMNVKPLRGL
jgi:hypothetical protein